MSKNYCLFPIFLLPCLYNHAQHLALFDTLKPPCAFPMHCQEAQGSVATLKYFLRSIPELRNATAVFVTTSLATANKHLVLQVLVSTDVIERVQSSKAGYEHPTWNEKTFFYCVSGIYFIASATLLHIKHKFCFSCLIQKQLDCVSLISSHHP